MYVYIIYLLFNFNFQLNEKCLRLLKFYKLTSVIFRFMKKFSLFFYRSKLHHVMVKIMFSHCSRSLFDSKYKKKLISWSFNLKKIWTNHFVWLGQKYFLLIFFNLKDKCLNMACFSDLHALCIFILLITYKIKTNLEKAGNVNEWNIIWKTWITVHNKSDFDAFTNAMHSLNRCEILYQFLKLQHVIC